MSQMVDLVIFGGTGDLSTRKLLPALFQLHRHRLADRLHRIIATGRAGMDSDAFREEAKENLHRFLPEGGWDEEVWETFRERLFYCQVDADVADHYRGLADLLDEGEAPVRLYYLATLPSLYGTICQHLRDAGVVNDQSRVVLEKPLGHDLASCRAINEQVAAVFGEEDTFRIDHYLGKETVQNLLALRFANELFEPVWNANYVDHVQITMAEDIGIGSRAGYYDGIGAARDVIQNHLLQLLALVAMEEPVSFDARSLRIEKEKVLAAVRLHADPDACSARGRYRAGWQGGEQVLGYLEEDGIPASSTTETYAALRLDVSTRRWAGVPFYLRTGKRLGRRVTEVAVVFKRAPHLPFDATDTSQLGQNALVVRVQPDEGVTIRFGSKVPGTAMEVRDVTMDFSYGHAFTQDSPEAYERLILDVLLGEPPLFPQQPEVELSWAILDPVLEHWARAGSPEEYAPGSWGPESADDLMARDGRSWRRP